jgi:hypothetical protein
MNKILLSVIVVAIFALGTVGYVFAQTPTPATPGATQNYGMGRGMMGGRGGMMGGMMGSADDQDGLLHDAMIAVYAEKLGISVDDLNARLAKGETMYQIATAKGLTAAEFQALISDARTQAIDQAVKAGTLTQAQADLMKQRGAGMMGGTTGGMGGMRGNRGAGQAANCPLYQQTNP